MSRNLSITGVRHRGMRSLGTAALLLSLICLASSLLLVGCGGGGEDTVLARVGDKEITLGYYEDRLGTLDPEDLPKDENDLPIDTATLAGKKAFLDVIINKELMAMKAVDLGYDEEEQVEGAEKAMQEYHMGYWLHKDLIETPANTVSEEELAEYHKNMGHKRIISFLITNFKEDALKARQAIIDGGVWEDVAEEYHDGSMPPNGSWQTTVPWGRFDDVFENAVYGLEMGEVSQPTETIYGYWVMRLEGVAEDEVGDLDAMRDRVLSGIRMRKINLARKAFMAELHEKYGFVIDEDGLWIAYQGLPEDEQIFQPGTQDPTPRDALQQLDIPTTDFDKVLYKVILDGEEVITTIGDYKAMFDGMNVFQRPKKGELLGGLRQRIVQDVERILVIQEARARGYAEDERVIAAVNPKVEEMMVSKLHAEVVQYEEYVSPEELDAFWAEHGSEYVRLEMRDGQVVYCASQDDAVKAHDDAVAGRAWAEILDSYGVDEENKASGGRFEPMSMNSRNPIKDAVFSLASSGDVSEPFPHNGMWAVVKLGSIEPQRQQELEEVREAVGQRIRLRRQDDALRALLDEWRTQFGVVVYEDALKNVRSWNELSVAAAE